MWKVNKLSVHKTLKTSLWLCMGCERAVDELSQLPTGQPHEYLKIFFKIIEYAIIVSQGRRPANAGHVHAVCMLSCCTVAINWSRCLFRTGYQFVMNHQSFSPFPHQLLDTQLHKVWISTATIGSWNTFYSIIVPQTSGSYLKWAEYYVNDTPFWTDELSGLSMVIIFSYWHRIFDGSSRDYAKNTMGSDHIVTDEIQP